MIHSEQLNELAAALSKAQAKIEGAKKDSANPFFKSTYADLASVWEAARKPMTDNGLSITQMPTTDVHNIGVETLLLHSSGQWISSLVWANAKDLSPQAVGSVITYLRRYALSAVLGIPQVDDDAESAEGRTDGKPVSQPTRTKDVGLDQQQAQQTSGQPCKVVSVTPKQFAKDGKPFTAYDIVFSDSRKASTLKQTLADAATMMLKNDDTCEAICVKNAKGYLNLMEIAIVQAPQTPVEPDLGW